MSCTYYGGSTAKFISDVLRHGIVPYEGVPDRFVVPGSEGIFSLNTAGSDVGYDEPYRRYTFNWVRPLPKTLIREVHSGGRRQLVINVEFLVTCKLLDLPTYDAALRVNPAPMALSLAIKCASKTIKPDFPRTRKGGVRLTDFIEELVYFDLQPIHSPVEDVSFKTFSYALGSNHGDLPLGCLIYTWNEEHIHSLELTKEAYLGWNNSGALDLKYFESLALLDVARVDELLTVMSPPEAFQRAVRERLGYRFPDASTLDLPSDLLEEPSLATNPKAS
jgi:hypothetical protein